MTGSDAAKNVLDPGFHPVYVRLLLAVLERRGLSVEACLRGAGWRSDELQDDGRFVAGSRVLRLVEQALQISGDPALGLELGFAAHALTHGPVGYASLAASTPFEALRVIARFSALRTEALHLSLTRGSSTTELRVSEQLPDGPSRRFVLEAWLVVLERLLTSLSGQSMRAAVYDLPWPRPAWSDRYAQVLDGQLRFGAAQLRVQCPNAVLDAPCMTADAEAHAAARADCERRIQQQSTHTRLDQSVMQRMRRSLPEVPAAQDMARQLGFSTRNFYRALAAAGLSYRQLRDQVRCSQALEWLLQGEQSLETIATRLGYQDASNFSRTFRRWTGVTPSDYRQLAEAGASLPIPCYERAAGSAD